MEIMDNKPSQIISLSLNDFWSRPRHVIDCHLTVLVCLHGQISRIVMNVLVHHHKAITFLKSLNGLTNDITCGILSTLFRYFFWLVGIMNQSRSFMLRLFGSVDVDLEISKCTDSATLFRANSMATKVHFDWLNHLILTVHACMYSFIRQLLSMPCGSNCLQSSHQYTHVHTVHRSVYEDCWPSLPAATAQTNHWRHIQE